MSHTQDHNHYNTDSESLDNDIGNTENEKNSEESREAGEQKLQEQIEAVDQKEENSPEQASASEEKAEASEKAGDDSVNPTPRSQQQYSSCSYTPPYYVPNFTAPYAENSENSQHQQSADNEKRKSVSVWVPIVVAIALVLSFTIGSLAGYTFSSSRDFLVNGSTQNMTVIKNNGSIKVNEKLGSTGYSNLSVSEVVDIVADSVVEITTSQVQTDLFYQSFVTSGAGSGVIIGEDTELGVSYIITNQHVVENSDTVSVRLTSGEEYDAEVVSGDADFDIAVIKIPVTGLSCAVLGSSESLQVGEEVVAIGNPLGELGGTVTNGIISALDRNVIVDGHRMTLLQTNTAINPGNSGGGLFNMAGELIGIVNAKQSDTGIEGLGFAIPIDVAWSAAKDLMDYGYVTGKVILGFEAIECTEAFQVRKGMYTYTLNAGIYIASSDRADLEAYDRIVSINGTNITQMSDYYSEIDKLQEGDTLTVVVSRLRVVGYFHDFEQKTVEVEVSFTKKP